MYVHRIHALILISILSLFIDSCVGMDCSMLRRHQEAKRESDDEWQLLNMAAQMSVLGGGVGDAFSKDSTSLYINSETQWRVLL